MEAAIHVKKGNRSHPVVRQCYDEFQLFMGENNAVAAKSARAGGAMHALGKMVGLSSDDANASARSQASKQATSSKNAARVKADLAELAGSRPNEEWSDEKHKREGGVAAASVTSSSGSISKPPFQRPANPKSTLIANGWIDQQRRSKMRTVWKQVLASVVQGRQRGEETTLWIQREVTGSNGKSELEALHQIPVKWIQEIHYLDFSADNRFTLKVFNLQEEFIFRCGTEEAAQNWVLTLRSIQESILRQKGGSPNAVDEWDSIQRQGRYEEKKAPDSNSPPHAEQRQRPRAEHRQNPTPHPEHPRSQKGPPPAQSSTTPSTSPTSANERPRVPVKELRAIAHGAGINTHGMERKELEDVVAAIQTNGASRGPDDEEVERRRKLEIARQREVSAKAEENRRRAEEEANVAAAKEASKAEEEAAARKHEKQRRREERKRKEAEEAAAAQEKRQIEEEEEKRRTDDEERKRQEEEEEVRQRTAARVKAKQEEGLRQRTAARVKAKQEEERQKREEEERQRLEAERLRREKEEIDRRNEEQRAAEQRRVQDEAIKAQQEAWQRQQQAWQQHKAEEEHRRQQEEHHRRQQQEEAYRHQQAQQQHWQQQQQHAHAQQQWQQQQGHHQQQHYPQQQQQQYYSQQQAPPYQQQQQAPHQQYPHPQQQQHPHHQQQPPPPPPGGAPPNSPINQKYAKMANQTENDGQQAISTIKHGVLVQWALQPPSLQTLRPIEVLMTTIHSVFPPKFGCPGHDYFGKWKALSLEDVKDGHSLDNEKLKKAVRKLRFFLHPDKLPRDLTSEQSYMCKMLWDITSDAWEEHQKKEEDLGWMK